MFVFILLRFSLILDLFERTNSPRFINHCFRYLDGSGDHVNIMFDCRIPFVPKVLQLNQITFDHKNERDFNVLNISNFILRNEDHSCEDALIIPVPDGQQAIQSIKITLTYGVDMFKIDEYEVIVNRNFRENAFTVRGLLKNTIVKMVIAHSHKSNHTRNLSPEFDLETIWINYGTKLSPGELYCVDIFTIEFSGKIIFSESFSSLHYISEFYILNINVFQNYETKNSIGEKYLVRVYPCQTSTSPYHILDIFVDKDTNFVDIEFTNKNFFNIFVILQRASQNRFKVIYTPNPYNFDLLVVISCDLTQEMVEEEYGMILHRSKHNIERCLMSIPGVLQKFKITKRVEKTVRNIVLRKDIYHLNRAGEEFGIFVITLVEDS